MGQYIHIQISFPPNTWSTTYRNLRVAGSNVGRYNTKFPDRDRRKFDDYSITPIHFKKVTYKPRPI